LKSNTLPLTNSALFGSITTRTFCVSIIMSRFAGPSTRSILYCNPEHPPPITATRKAPCGRPCRASSELNFAPAASLSFSSFSFPILTFGTVAVVIVNRYRVQPPQLRRKRSLRTARILQVLRRNPLDFHHRRHPREPIPQPLRLRHPSAVVHQLRA